MRPSFTAARDRREVVVRQDHPRGLLGHLGALDAHGDADVGLLERGRVVHAVAGHRHDLLVGLDRLHQPKLVLRAGAREHVDVAHALLQRGGVHLLDLCAGDRGLAVADAEHLGDRRGGDLVIAGDHRDADAAAMTFLHRRDGFLARRIEQADQSEQDEVARQVGRAETACLTPGLSSHASASTRSPCAASLSDAAMKLARSIGACRPSRVCWRSHRSRMTSGAPLTNSTSAPLAGL